MYKYIIKLLKTILPVSILNILIQLNKQYINLVFKIKLIEVKKNQQIALKKVRAKVKRKEKVKVVFFLLNIDSWKYDALINHFKTKAIFEIVVVIIPFVSKGKHFLLDELNKNINYCKNKNYNYLIGYDIINDKSKDIKKLLNPDIVFFSNPNNLTTENFLISNFNDILTCYVPYSFRIDTLYDYHYNNILVNLCWTNFYESNIHKGFAKKFARNKGNNVIVSGHPNLESFKVGTSMNPWKFSNNIKKRIIWGPHWTIPDYTNTGLDWSCFLDYAEYFLELANEFSSEILFCLKPHPLLKLTLEQESLWGHEKTNKYFKLWKTLPNTQVVDGNYTDLFIHSDALIHDSGAFAVEYLILNKPIAYTKNTENIDSRFNEYGNKAIHMHEIIYKKSELKEFIISVINGYDKNKQEREKFIEKYFKDSLQASQTIFSYIDRSINDEVK